MLDMIVKAGKIEITEEDLKDFEDRGYAVSRHTPYYLNGVTCKIGEHFEIGLHCWMDNAECWVNGNERVKIDNEEKADALLKLMDAIVAFNSI